MRRRALLLGAGYLVALPLIGRAQVPTTRPQVVVVSVGAMLPDNIAAFTQAITEAGLAEGRDFNLVYKTAEGDSARVPVVVGEVVTLNPAVIVSQTTGLTVELKRRTNSIPIIGNALADPVGLGLIASFAHPGGNVTGMAADASTPGKLLELLHEIVPGVTRVGNLYNPTNPGNVVGSEAFAKDAALLSITLVRVAATTASEIEPAFQELARAKVGALAVAQDAIFTPEYTRIASLALASGLPSINGFRNYAEAGGLMAYGSSLRDRWRQSGQYAARILKGERPGDLPFARPPKLELVINLKTAKALGLTIPPLLNARADEQIE